MLSITELLRLASWLRLTDARKVDTVLPSVLPVVDHGPGLRRQLGAAAVVGLERVGGVAVGQHQPRQVRRGGTRVVDLHELVAVLHQGIGHDLGDDQLGGGDGVLVVADVVAAALSGAHLGAQRSGHLDPALQRAQEERRRGNRGIARFRLEEHVSRPPGRDNGYAHTELASLLGKSGQRERAAKHRALAIEALAEDTLPGSTARTSPRPNRDIHARL